MDKRFELIVEMTDEKSNLGKKNDFISFGKKNEVKWKTKTEQQQQKLPWFYAVCIYHAY